MPTSQGVSLLIPYIKALLNRDWSVSVRHIPRECNKVADILAHLAWSLAPGLVTFQDPPVECVSAAAKYGICLAASLF
ncbi:putative Transcription initiation factor TFIID subunit [Hibiscus syriacus]|uniref:Transcription initiation factor TFIID subunit n=1 Tax=Hibiscus syriacus TaxID=106335 RepID=A0A6A2Y7T5_HIBSY|nr:putative Transcription initiation factor TFIID subunit [Hibiscus syriacus]